jgi:L-glyceraldehyde 3-phosphate reductase
MWPGPYGEWGSRKYLIGSLDQSLERMGLDRVDIFYSHRPDPHTPLEETMGALDFAVRSGRAIYAGISNYSPEQTARAAQILNELGTPCIIHQVKYSMFERKAEQGLLDVLEERGMGCIAFSPLAQGLLTDRYLHGIPEDSRAAKPHGFLTVDQATGERVGRARELAKIAAARGQSLAQLAIAWVLRHRQMTSALIGASRVTQIEEAVAALANRELDAEILEAIELALGDG